MPLTAKGEEILANLKREYGDEKGEQVFYAGRNKGTFTAVDSDDWRTRVDSVVDCVMSTVRRIDDMEARLKK